ncbi:Lon protease family protein [Haliangium sp.]|uniref:Lon protease family protein n=1 Tax=Haliangium sp. TaxID=2663208 RepID=UPI003D0E395E
MKVTELTADKLRRVCDPATLSFETTEDLDDLDEIIAQPRAVQALEFGVGVEHHGYNLYALGPQGIGKRFSVERFLNARAKTRPVPDDWCYVNNFEDPHQPRCLRLPPGRGRALEKAMKQLAEDLRPALESAFESDEYKTRRQVIDDEFGAKPEKSFASLRKHAEEKGFILLRTPVGVVFAPKQDGEVLPPEEFQKLPDDKREQIETEIKDLQAEFQELIQKLPDWERERQKRLRELNRGVTKNAVSRLIAELRTQFADLPEVLSYLEEVERDVVEHARAFLRAFAAEQQPQQGGEATEVPLPESLTGGSPATRRYHVNVIIDNGDAEGAPVVFADHPTYANLIGRVEHISQLGTLLTDFRLIRPGALHRANGGYLVIEARQLLMQPYAYEGLKRTLKAREICIESLGQALSLIATISLEPETIPLDVKVVLLGDRLLYYMMSAYDPEFSELFKVAVDFDDETAWSPDSVLAYSRMIATMARRSKLRPFDRTAVARLVEEMSRIIGDRDKLSTQLSGLVDLLREADHFASLSDKQVVAAADVQRAVDARVFRSDRIRARIQDEMLRETILIDTEGTRVGQVNGLSVSQLGDFRFGRPARITARIRLGKGNVIDIEREVELGGPLHSKGVMILSALLGARYGADKPLALSASLVFEQSYGGVDGDSASSAEFYALLSAIGGIPVRQSLAVTGSVNQHGEVQAIGGANEKIEGFFDLCNARGLTGRQGVLIPSANVKHLMLRQDVVDAVAEGRFHIHPIEHVDQGIELLTGLPAGPVDSLGGFSEGTVNAIVDARIAEMAETLASFGKRDDEGDRP